MPNASGAQYQPLPLGHIPHNALTRKDDYDRQVVITIPYDKEKLRTRMSTVEHPFGTIKWYHGAHFALLKGKVKVAGELALSFLAYNMRRALKLIGQEALLRALQDKELIQRACRQVL